MMIQMGMDRGSRKNKEKDRKDKWELRVRLKMKETTLILSLRKRTSFDKGKFTGKCLIF